MFFITTIERDENCSHCEIPYVKKVRTVGFFNTLQDATMAVDLDDGVSDTGSNFAVIEQLAPGTNVCSTSSESIWYQYSGAMMAWVHIDAAPPWSDDIGIWSLDE